MNNYLQIHAADNVAVALADLAPETEIAIPDNRFRLCDAIPKGHKFSIRPIKNGENVIKYGSPIGHATQPIGQGCHVHTHNLATNLSGTLHYEYNPEFPEITVPDETPVFNGYCRKNGDVGIRNELWVVPTVGCVNGIAGQMVKLFKERFRHDEIDAIEVFSHNYGCSQLGGDHANTRRVLANLATHPNAGGVLVLGLGCENNQISALIPEIGLYDPERVRFLVAQESEDEIEEGVSLLASLYNAMKNDRREPVPLSKLKVGLKCGGSDGFSGITANPLLGMFSDYLTALGGTTILTEVPEMFGAEHLLMQRAENRLIFDQTVRLVNDFKDYFLKHEQPVYENPSPGNKAGGITTLEEKSLGCTQKGGLSKVTGVLEYGEMVSRPGLNLLSAPGNDLVATSALGFSGCQLALFTTGRGTPFGSFIPTVKISTNSELASRKKNWIDFDAGTLLSGAGSQAVLKKFVEYIISVANGEKVNHEKNGFKEIAIFKSGVTL